MNELNVETIEGAREVQEMQCANRRKQKAIVCTVLFLSRVRTGT